MWALTRALQESLSLKTVYQRCSHAGYSPLGVTEVAAAQGRHHQAAILVPELNHSGVHSGDSLNREDNECWPLDTKKMISNKWWLTARTWRRICRKWSIKRIDFQYSILQSGTSVSDENQLQTDTNSKRGIMYQHIDTLSVSTWWQHLLHRKHSLQRLLVAS